MNIPQWNTMSKNNTYLCTTTPIYTTYYTTFNATYNTTHNITYNIIQRMRRSAWGHDDQRTARNATHGNTTFNAWHAAYTNITNSTSNTYHIHILTIPSYHQEWLLGDVWSNHCSKYINLWQLISISSPMPSRYDKASYICNLRSYLWETN